MPLSDASAECDRNRHLGLGFSRFSPYDIEFRSADSRKFRVVERRRRVFLPKVARRAILGVPWGCHTSALAFPPFFHNPQQIVGQCSRKRLTYNILCHSRRAVGITTPLGSGATKFNHYQQWAYRQISGWGPEVASAVSQGPLRRLGNPVNTGFSGPTGAISREEFGRKEGQPKGRCIIFKHYTKSTICCILASSCYHIL